MSSVSEYFSGLFTGIKSLLTGLRVTGKELVTKKVTGQYPENRDTLVICGICQINCPNGTIKVISKMVETEEGKKKKVLDRYIYDLGMCTFCNLCVLTCPSNAIQFSNQFENAMFRREGLIEQLNHEGSKLREKKKEPKPDVDKPVAPAVPKTEWHSTDMSIHRQNR